ncbi:MAG: hypothetical protein ABI840_10335, partial [bacterium]
PFSSNVWVDFSSDAADFCLDMSPVGGNGVLNLTAIPEGFYNLSGMNMKDTIRVYLRDSVFPYAIIDLGKGVIDSLTFSKSITIHNVSTGLYYVVVKHRNSIETWSNLPVSYVNGSTTNYDFTNLITKAFGNNLILTGSKYCLYSGDVNQDGSIDLSDLSLIDNDVNAFVSGYVNTDVTGDNFVDLTDMSITDNNAYNFITKATP